MKKLIVIVLVAALAFSAFACSTQSATDTAAASTTESAAVAAETSAAASTAAASDSASPAAAGEKLKIAYFAITMSNQWLQNIEAAMKTLGEKYNFEVVTADAAFSAETQLSQIDTMLNQGIDAASVFVADEGSGSAVVEKFAAAGIPVVGESLKLMDADGNLVAPVVELDAAAVGTKCAQWTAENYEALGFDFSDLSKVGLMLDTRSTYQSDLARSDAFKTTLLAAIPGFVESNVYIADCAAEANSSDDAEASYNQVSAVLAAHPEIESWVIFGSVDDYALGAARAVEAAGLEEKVLLTSSGGERAVQEWASGMAPCWRATCYYDAMTCAKIVVDGLLQMVNDGIAEDALWSDHIDAGQTYASYKFSGEMVTPDTYADYIASLSE